MFLLSSSSFLLSHWKNTNYDLEEYSLIVTICKCQNHCCANKYLQPKQLSQLKVSEGVTETNHNAKVQFSNTVAVQHMLPHNCYSMSLTLNKGQCVTPWQKERGAKFQVGIIEKIAAELISRG